MKIDLENRLKNFHHEVDKFVARWNQLKPSAIDSDSSVKELKEAAGNIRDRKLELDEVMKSKDKLL